MSSQSSKTAGKVRVGVSIHVRKGSQSLWENGIFQNCVFMVQLLQASPLVSDVYLVCGGDGDADDRKRFIAESPCPLVGLAEAHDLIDVIVEMSAGLGPDWVNPFRAKGGKVISYYVGNDFVLDSERMSFDLPNAWLVPDAPRDRIWTLAEYERTCKPYYEAAVRAPVSIMQHLWSPEILLQAAREHGVESLDYQPGARRWQVAIVEPNLSMVKTFHIPALSCEVAHRRNPEFLKHLWIFNTRKYVAQPIFNAFVSSLDVVRHGLASFEDRHPVYEIFGKRADAIVSHHWENGQNYIYYEALYAGYPLIHNSPFLDGCGYRYADFDCEDGGRALLQAYAEHDQQLDAYKRAGQAYIARLAPHAPQNVAMYTQEIGRICGI